MSGIEPIEREELPPHDPTDALVEVTRPNGSKFLLRVPVEHLPRLVELARGEFGDKSIKPEAVECGSDR